MPTAPARPLATNGPPTWAKVIDHTRCIGCHACTTACKSENDVPLSVTRTFVKYVDAGTFPNARRSFQVTRCNQCERAPCVAACPTAAMHRRPDGIVDFDKSICIGCKACIAACPYDAIFINPDDGCAEKCNFCAHRLEMGLEPACVVVCPTEAILVGDLNDPLSKVARIVDREAVAVRRPEKGTRPKLFYMGADHVTLDPLAARRPDGGLFLWSEQGAVPHQVPSGHPGPHNSSAAAVVSYDTIHRAPWDWRVSLYTFTKSVAAGAYLVPLLAVVAGWLPVTSPAWTLVGPALALASLVVTAALLVWDLEHPERFWMVLAKPQWRSWLVRGGFILTAYGGVLAVHVGLTAWGRVGPTLQLAWAGGPLALGAAAYTAYLFGQAAARDLWQSPLLAPHLVVQAVLAGAGATLLVGGLVEGFGLDLAGGAGGAAERLWWVFRLAAFTHVALALVEAAGHHPTEHAALAARELTRGRWSTPFWWGLALAAAGAAAPAAAPAAGVVGIAAALAGLFLYEHAYVQAGQCVPLA